MNSKVAEAYKVLKESGLTLEQIEQEVSKPEVPEIEPCVARRPGDTRYTVDDSEFFTRVTTIDGVKYRRHKNGGGLVSETATAEATAFVGVNAWVYGNAKVYGNAWVYGNAKVFGDAEVIEGVHV